MILVMFVEKLSKKESLFKLSNVGTKLKNFVRNISIDVFLSMIYP